MLHLGLRLRFLVIFSPKSGTECSIGTFEQIVGLKTYQPRDPAPNETRPSPGTFLDVPQSKVFFMKIFSKTNSQLLIKYQVIQSDPIQRDPFDGTSSSVSFLFIFVLNLRILKTIQYQTREIKWLYRGLKFD